jgi:dihydroflavonol-4-reductase
MNALITGATGFIGSHLTDSLQASGVRVHALIRDPGRLRFLAGSDVHLLEGDLFHVPALPAGLSVVFHLAGLTKSFKPADYITVNRKGTASLIEAVVRSGSKPRFVYLSSLSASGPSGPAGRRAESAPPSPVTPYGRSKLMGESEVLARGDVLPVVVVRVGAVYGPRDREYAKYFRFMKLGLLPRIGRKPRPLGVCYVEDLVRGLIVASNHPSAVGEIFNIGNSAPTTLEDMGRQAGRFLGRRLREIVVPLAIVRAVATAGEIGASLSRRATILSLQKFAEYVQAGWVPDVGKAKNVLGFEATVPLDRGIRKTVNWYLSNGWL